MEKTDLEREREELMARNKARMTELNLMFAGSKLTGAFGAAKPRPVGATPKRRPAALLGPSRKSARMEGARAKGVGLSLAESDADWLDEEDEWLEEDDSEPRQHRVKRNLPRETVYTGAREYQLPDAIVDGRNLGRNRSCHVCTQCVASWRGNFSTPLACATCPKIFCSRCLFHINGADDLENVYDFVEEHQGRWSCFYCTETCACQDPALKGLPKIDRHKSRGWVGVSGGRVGAVRKPSSRRGAKRAPRPVADSPSSAMHENAKEEEPVISAACGQACAAEGVAVMTTAEGAALLSSPLQESMDSGKSEASAVLTPSSRRPVNAKEIQSPTLDAEVHDKEASRSQSPGNSTRSNQQQWEGVMAVGRRVKAYWPAEQNWFTGVVESYNHRTATHRILYDDGDFEMVGLPDDTVLFTD